MKITEETIPLIENALNIKLYSWQKESLINRTRMPAGRGNGKTLTWCIDLALSDGEPINTTSMERYSDYGDGSVRYARGFFKKLFLDVWNPLKATGLPVREVRF